MDWHEKVRAARQQKGLSQADLARAVGASQALINKIERGQLASSQFFDAINAVLGISSDEAEEDLKKLLVKHVSKARLGRAEVVDTRQNVNVYNTTSKYDGSFTIEETASLPRVALPPGLSDGIGFYALMVPDRFMSPELEPGDIVFINPVLPIVMDSLVVLNFFGRDSEPNYSRFVRITDITEESIDFHQWLFPNEVEGKRAPFKVPRSRVAGMFRISDRMLRR